MRSYLFRSAISYSIFPGVDVTDITFTTADGSFTMPWLGLYGPGLGDSEACVDVDSVDVKLVADAKRFDKADPLVGLHSNIDGDER